MTVVLSPRMQWKLPESGAYCADFASGLWSSEAFRIGDSQVRNPAEWNQAEPLDCVDDLAAWQRWRRFLNRSCSVLLVHGLAVDRCQDKLREITGKPFRTSRLDWLPVLGAAAEPPPSSNRHREWRRWYRFLRTPQAPQAVHHMAVSKADHRIRMLAAYEVEGNEIRNAA